MGTNLETARALARGWWELDVADRSRKRGYAPCNATPAHKVKVGGGCLCKPLKAGEKSPDLVCEECFERLPYEPWDGGKAQRPDSSYPTVDEALASVGRRSIREAVSAAPVAGVEEPPPPARGPGVRALIACLIAGAAAGALTAARLAGSAETRADAAKDGGLAGLGCGLAAWLVGLAFRRADDVAGRRGVSIDRPDAAWRLTPAAAALGAAVAVVAPGVVRWLVSQPLYRAELAPYSERLARAAADPAAAAGLGVALSALLATLLPWGLANFRGLGRGLGAVDGAARRGALIGAVAAAGLTGAVLTLRPDLAPFDQGRAAPWVVYVAPVVGFLAGSRPRNSLVRGLFGAAAGYAAAAAVAAFWSPEVDPALWVDRLADLGPADPRTWDGPTRMTFCLGLPAAGALLGALLSGFFLRVFVGLAAATLAGGWALLAAAALVPGVASRAPGGLGLAMADVPSALGPQTVLLGALAGLFAVGGAARGFLRGALAALVGLLLAYGLAYLCYVVGWPSAEGLGADGLAGVSRRGLRWVGVPALTLAPLGGYLLGRGRFAALAAGALGYALGLLVALPAAEALGVDVGPALAARLGVRPVIWPALLAVAGVGAAAGVMAALAVASARRRRAFLKYVNRFDCGWCGRRATRDARPSAAGPLLPVCGDPACNRRLADLLADPTVRRLLNGPTDADDPEETPELPEEIREKAAPGRMERLRRLARTYDPAAPGDS